MAVELKLEAQQLVNRMQQRIIENGIVPDELADDLMAVREAAIEAELPRVAKVLRLTKEHLEEYEGFNIPMPEDEPVTSLDEEEDAEEEEAPTRPTLTPIEDAEEQKESLQYMLSIIAAPYNKMNAAELKEYRDALKEYAELY